MSLSARVLAAGADGRHTRLRSVSALAVLLASILALPVEATVPTIPPGNEEVVAEMLGKGAPLTGDCKLTGGSIEKTFVAARYECGGVPAVVELRHPSEDAGAAARTERFAIVPRGAVPPALIVALTRSVGAAESRFEWTVPLPTTPSTAAAAPDSFPLSLEVTPLRGNLALLFLVAVLAAPLAVIAGVVASYLAAFAGRGPLARHDRRRLVYYLVLFLAVVALGALRVVPNWGMQLDEERDFIFSAVCAAGKGCPIVGNEMNQLRIKLGPLARYLMTLCQLVTPDPRFTLSVILALHALGAAWLAAAGDLLLGFPIGLGAGALFGANPLLLYTIAAASNGAWSSFFLVGTVVGTMAWVRGNARAFVVAATCAAIAVQSHGTNLVLLPPLALAWLLWRPPLTVASVAASVLITSALYSPWLLYQWLSGATDFSLASTAWMMSEGPGWLDRVARVVPTMGGLLATFLASVGMGVLAMGRFGAVGRAVLLFLVLPLGAALLAGGGWSGRYGVPAIVPGALAAATGLCLLLRRRNIGRIAVAALVLVWIIGGMLEGILVRHRPAPAVETKLGLAQQIEAIRILGQHGFGTLDLESRVHGVVWDRWDGGQAYLGKWLIGTERRAEAGQHAVLVQCERVEPGFGSWQQSLASSPPTLRNLLVGYRAQLAPVVVEIDAPGGTPWSRPDGLPFYSQMEHGGDSQLRALFDPRLAYPAEFAALQIAWRERPPTTMKLTTRLSPGSEDRTVVLLYDPGMSASLAIDGVPRASIAPAAPAGSSMREAFFVAAAERRSGLAVEATIDLGPSAEVPRRVDLYEEPACGEAAGGMAEP